MKSELTNQTNIQEYPVLKINGTKETVVLFTAPKTGIVVWHKSGDYLGMFKESWNEPTFSTFIGTLNLSN